MTNLVSRRMSNVAPPAPATDAADRSVPVSAFRLVAALVSFGLLALGTGLPFGLRADHAVTAWLKEAPAAAAAPAASLVSLAEPEVLLTWLVAAALVLLLFGDRRHGYACLWLAAGTVGVSLLAALPKHAIDHPAPVPMRPVAGIEFTVGVPAVLGLVAAALVLLMLHGAQRRRALLWIGAGAAGFVLAAVAPTYVIGDIGRHVLQVTGLYPVYGFPSGHTMRTTFLAGTALRRVPALALCVVVGMMVSLVYLGLHWMSEVLGGFCLGWACVEGAREFWRFVYPDDSSR
ncbi:MAG TPA: phosphatase PAP2 family protein [bacterium]|nr:phosphatase PAP2 family protein [bacterium]